MPAEAIRATASALIAEVTTAHRSRGSAAVSATAPATAGTVRASSSS